MTMLSNDRHRRAPGGVSRSGGRTAARLGPVFDAEQDYRESIVEHAVAGSAALAPSTRPVALQDAEVDLELGDQERSADHDEDAPRLRVAPPAPVRTPRAPFVVLVIALVVTGVVGILVLNTKINENVFRLANLQDTQTTLDTQEEQLQADLAEQAAPGTVAGKARELGMQLPTKPPAFIILPDGRKLDVPQPSVGKH